MIVKVSDLKRIKEIFEKIAANRSHAKKDLAVMFKWLSDNIFEIVMSSGDEQARIICNSNDNRLGDKEVSINWKDFSTMCDLFRNEICVTSKDQKVKFSEGNTVFKCRKYTSGYNENCNFKFDFDNAVLLHVDNTVILRDFGTMNGYAIGTNKLISTDSNICTISTLNSNIGDKVHVFKYRFPTGKWFFNSSSNIIVSEDKRVACTVIRLNIEYPFFPLINLSNQVLNNYFECNVELFQKAIDNCSKINEKKIAIEFKEDSLLFVSTSDKFGAYKTEVPCAFEHITPKPEVCMIIKYISELTKCADKEGKLRVYFDDNPNEYKVKSENDKLKIFAMSLMTM